MFQLAETNIAAEKNEGSKFEDYISFFMASSCVLGQFKEGKLLRHGCK